MREISPSQAPARITSVIFNIFASSSSTSAARLIQQGMHIVFSFDLTDADSEKNRGVFVLYLRALGFLRVRSVSLLGTMAGSPLALGQIRDMIVDHARSAKVRLGGIVLSRGSEFIEENHPTTTALDRLLALGICPAGGLTRPASPSWSSLLAVPPPHSKPLGILPQEVAG